MNFEQIYQKNNQRLSNAVYCMCKGDKDTAEDILQMVWLKVHTALPKFNGESAPYTWLYRIAVNTYLDYVRTSHFINMRDSEDVDEIELEDVDDPESLAISMEISDKVTDFLSKADETTFQVFVDKVLRGMSYQEIAHVEQIPLGTVKSRVNRMYKRLKDELS